MTTKQLFLTAITFIVITATAPLLARDYVFAPEGANFYLMGRGQSQFIINRSRLTARALDDDIRKLSSGKRIITAADDPAGLAIAEKMTATLKGLGRESMNHEDYRNLLNYADAMAGQTGNLLQRIRELIVRSGSGILNRDDREIIQNEIDELLKQIDMNARFGRFNSIQVIPELSREGLGLMKLDVTRNPSAAMGMVDAALAKTVARRVKAGIQANVLTFRIDGLQRYLVNAAATLSRIGDQDMAEGITRLRKNSVLLKTQNGVLILGK